jgi:glutathione S-transferase
MNTSGNAVYELFYWPAIQGRGEFVRLVFEALDLGYRDVGREADDGFERVSQQLTAKFPAYAPPVLKIGDAVIAQTSNICLHLAKKHGLISTDEEIRLHANQVQLTLQDFLQEIHDTHHPIAVGLYYEDQKEAARRCARFFRENRLPTFLSYFEKAAEATPGDFLLGDELSYVDLSMFQVLEGLAYAFPNAYNRYEGEVPELTRIRGRVRSKSRIENYLASSRRISFNEDGIFRHYPELDQ